MKLRIAKETDDEILAYCPFHNNGNEKNPSMILNKTGEFAGRYHCFGCNADGKIKDLGINMKYTKSSKKKKEKKDWYELWEKNYCYGKHEDVNRYNDLVLEWNVGTETLRNYGYGWTGSEHCYPMCNEDAQIIGIQRRYENGRKVNIKGSRLGLFLPKNRLGRFPIKRLFIMEGWSDTITCADLLTKCTDLAIGRPNAKAVRDMCVRFCKKWVDKSCLINILPDSDVVGGDGAIDLMKDLRENGFKESQIWPIWGFKDFRCMVQKKGKEFSRKWLGV